MAAVKLGLFTELASGSLHANEIQARLKLHGRGLPDFLDALHSLGFLNRDGAGTAARYSNTDATGTYLNRHSPHYIGGILEISNDRLYRFWGDLEEGLRTGKPQNEVKHTGKNQFDDFYANPKKMESFLEGMSGIQRGNFTSFAQRFDFSKYKVLCDIGGATGQLSISVAKSHPHMQCISFDLPVVQSYASEHIRASGLGERVRTVAGDFFRDSFPNADVFTMGNVLHDWGMNDKKLLMKKAYDALSEGGALAVIETIIDDERRQNTFGLLISLTMLIETHEGYDFTFAEFTSLAKAVGFTSTTLMPLMGPSSAAIAFK